MNYGLLGEHLSHSYSPRIHKEFGDYAYGLYEVAPEDLDAFLKQGDFRGLNVTIPYKKAVMSYCTELSETAKAMGCVNTLIRREDGSLYGHNTDCGGFALMLERMGGPIPGAKALVLGTGGAAGTVTQVLCRGGMEVVQISRSGVDNYSNYDRHADAKLLVNATPVGMYPNNGNSPVDLRKLPNLTVVLDLIYNPCRTQLLLDAEKLGIPREDGLSMLVAQAMEAAELFTGKKTPMEHLEKVLRTLRGEMGNLILIGMPGSGKSTVGKALAERLGRNFADSDEEIVKRIGSIPEYFANYGEEAFRKVETEVLGELGKRSGLVIATGGGAVTREENYPLLHQNGTIIRLHRDLDLLPTEGRPLSQRQSLEAMFAKRDPLYRTFADVEIKNSSTVEDTVEQIMEKCL
ncbi:MAG: shikimate kinase [Oscillospiraceae bacterium]|nr:shikimate kinase [Oscillospiraceae bacterium]